MIYDSLYNQKKYNDQGYILYINADDYKGNLIKKIRDVNMECLKVFIWSSDVQACIKTDFVVISNTVSDFKSYGQYISMEFDIDISNTTRVPTSLLPSNKEIKKESFDLVEANLPKKKNILNLMKYFYETDSVLNNSIK